MTSRTGSARRILGIWRKWVELRPASGEDGWLSLAHGDLCGGCHTCLGCRWKSQNRKIVPLSPYVEKPLNSKVIKSFVPELRSRKCFSCFEIPMLYIYEHYMSISHTHIMAMVHLLYFDPRLGQLAIPRWCTGRKWHIPMAVMRGNRVGLLG